VSVLHPALARLLWLKARGGVRRQLARARTPKGALLLLLGGAVILLAFGSIALGSFGARGKLGPQELAAFMRVGLLALSVMTLAGAVAARGLHIPREEIDVLFSAPLARADLVRYRMVVNGLRSLPGALVLALVLAPRAPNGGCALLGIVLGMQALGLLGQLASLELGTLEQRALKRIAGWPALILSVGALATFAFFMIATFAGSASWFEHPGAPDSLQSPSRMFVESGAARLADHPFVRTLALPAEPFVRVAAAPSLLRALPWLLVALAELALAFELIARRRIDFRELSLETASKVAERIRRAGRSGGGASAASADARASLRRMPWLAGRGPLGAIVWRKSIGIARKARGTLLVGLSVLAVSVFITGVAVRGLGPQAQISRACALGMLGTFYLASALRFDFREDLDRMESIKSWPLSAWRVFVATLLPEIALVVALLALAMIARQAYSGASLATIAPVVLGLPLFVGTWVALDNALFLLAPVRFVPGQSGNLQHAGVMLLQLFLRAAVLFALLLLIGVPVAAVWLVGRVLLHLPTALVSGLAAACGALVWIGALAALCWYGGRLLARFDVSRERA